jgi:mercuric ion transport protein
MIHSVDTLDNTAQVESPEKPSRKVVKVRLSVAARLARAFYAFLSSALAAGVLFQVFFAGMGAFGADWSYHVTLARFLGFLPLLMVPTAFVGRLPWALRLLPLGIVLLVGAQFALAHSVVPAAALHPVNGFLILLTSFFIARRAWATVRRKG